MHYPQFYQEHSSQSTIGPQEVTEWIGTNNHDLHGSRTGRQYAPHLCRNAGTGWHIPFNVQRLTSSCRVNNGTTNISLHEKERCTTNTSPSFFSIVSLNNSLFFTFLWRQHTINHYVEEHASPAKRMRKEVQESSSNMLSMCAHTHIHTV